MTKKKERKAEENSVEDIYSLSSTAMGSTSAENHLPLPKVVTIILLSFLFLLITFRPTCTHFGYCTSTCYIPPVRETELKGGKGVQLNHLNGKSYYTNKEK